MMKQIFSLILSAALMISCASANTDAPAFSAPEGNESRRTNTDTNNSVSNVSGIEGNEWKLIEVYINGEDTLFRRDSLPKELVNFFTLTFDAEHLSGVGAPNRYSAPYTQGDNQTIKAMLIRSTMMASFFQPEKLDEHDFFVYLQNIYAWEQVDNTLALLSKTQNGGEVKLVFSL